MAEVRRRYDIPPYTEGWFQLGWSDELAPGQLREVKHFGETYVLFRGRDGALGLLDDLCPHLGARFSQGGCVEESSVRCPYHHWAFDKTGACTRIPYSKSIPVKARVRKHTVLERYGMIFMHHNKAGTAPEAGLPVIENFDPSEYTAPARYEFALKIHGQDIMENSVDSPHFYAVHGFSMPVNTFRADGKTLRVTQDTSVKRFGTTLHSRLEFHLVEPGFHYVHFTKMPGPQAFVFSSIVPIDDSSVRHRLSIYTKKIAVPLVSEVTRQFLVWQMMKTYREDLQIWESKQYLRHPVLCDGDGSIVKLRRWYAQFFEPSDAVAAPAA